MEKRILACFICLLLIATAKGQFYFRGDVTDAAGQPLSLVRIHILSANNFYYSGSSGSFGIPSLLNTDSAELSLNGYETKTVLIKSTEFNRFVLKASSPLSSSQKKKRLSITEDQQDLHYNNWSIGGETYSELIENRFNNTAQSPRIGLSLNVDKASYSNIRRFLTMQSMVPPDAVRIEEMLNYFPVPLKEIETGKWFAYESLVTDCPWKKEHRLLMMRLHSKKISYDSAPPANIVLLIDVSGSMDLPNRLPLLKTAFRSMVQNLRPIDTLSIVTYGGSVAVALYPTGSSDQAKILSVIDSLQASGDTPGGSALRTAYNLLQPRMFKGGNNRIIMATDGDFNVGEITEEALMQLIAQKQQSGIYLTCLGVGMGNYKDSKLEALARKGNGNFAYLDNEREAEKVLVTECMQTFYISASNAFLNINFDSSVVRKYRLIGYDNRKDAITDTSVAMEGGEMGSGHTVTAVFEIEPANEFISLHSPIATGSFSYTPSGAKIQVEELLPFCNSYKPIATVDSSYRFASGIVLFGLLLRQSIFAPEDGWSVLLNMLPSCINPANYLQQEMYQLVLKAKEIYQPSTKMKTRFRKKNRKE